MTQIGLVTAGYAGSLLAAGLTFYALQLRAQEDPAQYNNGMSAGGDFILVLAVFGFCALFPTGLALYFLRSSGKFWNLFSIFSLAVAATAPLAEALNTLIDKLQLYHQPLWVSVGFISMLRVGGSILLAFGFAGFSLFAPQPRARRLLLIAAGIEGAVFLYVVLHFLLWKLIA